MRNLFLRVIAPLTYYSKHALRAERRQFTAEKITAMTKADPLGVLVAEEGGRLVGFLFSDWNAGLIWIQWVGVARGHEGRGIGRALIAELLRTLPQRKAHKVWCDCRVNNKASYRLLKRCGFRIIGRVKNHWYGHEYYLWESAGRVPRQSG